MAGPLSEINRALSRKDKKEGVARKNLGLDEDLRKRREEERLKRAREDRRKMLGLK